MAYVKHYPGEIIKEGYVLLEQAGKDKNGYILGKFSCPYCETLFITRIADIKKGHTKSCGCLASKAKSENGKKNIIDYTGQSFGRLQVLYRSERKNSYNNNAYWHCKCECGRELDVSSANIKKTQSCGCLQSKAEYKINQILTQANIPFETQKTFPSCAINNNKLRFDYYLPDKNILIEYDGIQHFESSASGWDTQEKLLKTQQYDAFKNLWCKENHIPLIRIPYTNFDKLSLEYLMYRISEEEV